MTTIPDTMDILLQVNAAEGEALIKAMAHYIEDSGESLEEMLTCFHLATLTKKIVNLITVEETHSDSNRHL